MEYMQVENHNKKTRQIVNEIDEIVINQTHIDKQAQLQLENDLKL